MPSIEVMRAISASSMSVAGAAALLLPLLPQVGQTPALAEDGAAHTSPHRTADHPSSETSSDRAGKLPGSTRSLPLTALDGGSGKSPGSSGRSPGGASLPEGRGLSPRSVPQFSTLGVVWDDASAPLKGKVQVRTRSVQSGSWSGWKTLDAHADHAPDARAAERTGSRVRGATAPMWVGDSNGVQVRVLPGKDTHGASGDHSHREGSPNSPQKDSPRDQREGQRQNGPKHGQEHGQDSTKLPKGLRIELIDPGPDSESGSGQDGANGTSGSGNKRETRQAPAMLPPQTLSETRKQTGRSHIGPRPGIVIRKGWGADEGLREKQFSYTNTVRAAFVHHTASSSNYSCSQAPSIIRGIYRYHVTSSKWRDVGYNFFVDKCGTIYEGRAGGVARPVLGAHTYGYNHNSMGVAVIGSYGNAKPSRPATEAISKLTAWKLGLFGINPKGTVKLGSGNKTFNAISGHRDAFSTACPGERLYQQLGPIRDLAAKLQRR